MIPSKLLRNQKGKGSRKLTSIMLQQEITTKNIPKKIMLKHSNRYRSAQLKRKANKKSKGSKDTYIDQSIRPCFSVFKREIPPPMLSHIEWAFPCPTANIC